MSKISEVKRHLNYQDKPIQRRCIICKHLKITLYTKDCGGFEKLRCNIGKFIVKANALCDSFEMKDS